MENDLTKLTQLGSKATAYTYTGPSAEMLETFINPQQQHPYHIIHRTKEFSSLCPKTGQPDFGEIYINYIPTKMCVETKSLKLYLFAYRNEGCFMETIANKIFKDLVDVLQPKWLDVTITFAPRGGIETKVTVSTPPRGD